MPMLNFIVGVTVLSFALGVTTVPGESREVNAPCTVVQLSKSPHGVRYSVDSKPIGNTAGTDILYVLNEVREKRGQDALVVVLIDPRVSIDEIWNLEGVADKAQLNNLRFFVRTRDPEKMAEIKWGPLMPYSTNPLLPR